MVNLYPVPPPPDEPFQPTPPPPPKKYSENIPALPPKYIPQQPRGDYYVSPKNIREYCMRALEEIKENESELSPDPSKIQNCSYKKEVVIDVSEYSPKDRENYVDKCINITKKLEHFLNGKEPDILLTYSKSTLITKDEVELYKNWCIENLDADEFEKELEIIEQYEKKYIRKFDPYDYKIIVKKENKSNLANKLFILFFPGAFLILLLTLLFVMIRGLL